MLVLGCGSDPPNNGADASADATADKVTVVVCDFPCRNPWSCVDSTHWAEMQSVSKPQCEGLMCVSTGVTHACDPGLECVTDPQPGNTPPCAYGGHFGCSPAAVSSFSPQPIGSTPTKQPGTCSAATIAQFWSDCLDPTTSDTTKCTSLGKLYPACACLVPVLTDVASGLSGEDLVPNVGGCYAALDGTSAPGSCAALDDANMQCAIKSCEACEAFADAFPDCVLAARKTTCSAFPICDGEAGTSYATCEPTSMKDFFIAFGEALCGP